MRSFFILAVLFLSILLSSGAWGLQTPSKDDIRGSSKIPIMLEEEKFGNLSSKEGVHVYSILLSKGYYHIRLEMESRYNGSTGIFILTEDNRTLKDLILESETGYRNVAEVNFDLAKGCLIFIAIYGSQDYYIQVIDDGDITLTDVMSVFLILMFMVGGILLAIFMMFVFMVVLIVIFIKKGPHRIGTVKVIENGSGRGSGK